MCGANTFAGSCTNPRFHSHVDAVSHVYLRDALKKMAPTASTVKVYPVSDLELGPQAAEKSGDFAVVYTGGTAGAASDAAGAAATGGAASSTSTAATTYVAAAADAHFTPVYKRLANFHRITGNPIDEAFATVQVGADGCLLLLDNAPLLLMRHWLFFARSRGCRWATTRSITPSCPAASRSQRRTRMARRVVVAEACIPWCRARCMLFVYGCAVVGCGHPRLVQVLVECEENIYEASVDPATGKLTVAYDLG